MCRGHPRSVAKFVGLDVLEETFWMKGHGPLIIGGNLRAFKVMSRECDLYYNGCAHLISKLAHQLDEILLKCSCTLDLRILMAAK